MTNIKIVRVVTVPEAFVHFKPFLRLLKEKGSNVTLVSASGSYEKVMQDELQLAVNPIEFAREIMPWSDLKSLLSLIIFFKKNKFDIIHSSTPKAGLLTAIAGLFSYRSIRIHTFTGQRWANLENPVRGLLKFFDKLIISLNTQCYADSLSQINFMVKEGVAAEGEIKCLHKGSYGGIDCDRFNNELLPQARSELFSELKLPANSFVVLYVGQLSKDKGLDDLVEAFVLAKELNKKLRLVLLGLYREGIDSLKAETLNEIKNNADIYSLGYKPYPEKYFSAADVFCLPSHREGFGTVVLEAAACGLATIGTRIPGLVDAIVDGETGVLVDLENTKKLSEAMLDLAGNEQKRKFLGENAKQRARTDFDAKLISELQWQEYQRLIKMRSR